MAAKRAKRVFERVVAETLALNFAGGERLETTANHPFYVEGKGFTPAGELGIGTLTITRAGPAARLAQIEHRIHPPDL